MKVLLINPNREHVPWPTIPIGLCTVASAVSRRGYEVHVLDLTFSGDPSRDTQRAISQFSPSVVGLTIRNIDNCNFEAPVFFLDDIRRNVVSAIREHAPSATLVLGGSGVNVAPWEILHYFSADYALVGEGEDGFPNFLDALAQETNLETVQGVLALRGKAPLIDEGKAFGNDREFRGEPHTGRALVSDLNATARCDAWRWIDLPRYLAHGSPYPIQTKRGCALRCVYCVYNNIEGRTYRLRSATNIVDEIEEAVRFHGVRHVDFVDSTFNLPRQHALDLCEELARRALPVELSTMGINPAAITPELLTLMKRAGFTNIMCTPESASDVTLKSLRKGYKKEAVIRAAQYLRDAELKTFWFFMLGAIGETMETVKETLRFCEEYIPPTDMVLFSTGIRVYPGTPLEKECKALGWFAPEDPLLLPSWYVSPELDLKQLYQTLSTAAQLHPNWMTNAETILSPKLAMLMKQGFKLLGWRGPFWAHLPKLNRFSTKIGARQKNLQKNLNRVSLIRDIRHHQS